MFFGDLLRRDRARVWGALQHCHDLITVNRDELQSIEQTARSIDAKVERAIDSLPSHRRRRTRPDRNPRSGTRASRAAPSGAKDLAHPSESTRKTDTRPEFLALNHSCSDLYLPPGSSEAGENENRQVSDMSGKTRSPAAAPQCRNRLPEAKSEPELEKKGGLGLLPMKDKGFQDVSQCKGKQTSSSKSSNVTEQVAAMDRAGRSPSETLATDMRNSLGTARLAENKQLLEKTFVSLHGPGDYERLARRLGRPLQARVSSVDDNGDDDNEGMQNNSEG